MNTDTGTKGKKDNAKYIADWFRLIILILLVGILTVSCSDPERAEQIEMRRQLTELYGSEIEEAYQLYKLAVAEACQSQDATLLKDVVHDGIYLDFLKQKVEDSSCVPTDYVIGEVAYVSVNELHNDEDGDLEISAIIVERANDEQYEWISTFNYINSVWKLSRIDTIHFD